MHYSINPENIKAEIEELGHSVTNIWNIKQYRPNSHSPCFSSNYNLPRITKITTMQNKILTAQIQKRHCPMCKLTKIWAHQKLLPP
jgi:hypothetical protein